MHLSKEDEIATDYAAFEKNLIEGKFQRIVIFEPEVGRTCVFLSLYVLRAISAAENAQAASMMTLPYLVRFSNFLRAHNKLFAIHILLWSLSFCRAWNIPGRSQVTAALNRQLADIFLQSTEEELIHLLAPAFQDQDVIQGFPQEFISRAPAGTQAQMCGILCAAIFKHKASYKLGRGHVQLVQHLFVRALDYTDDPFARRQILENIDVTTFLLSIWDQVAAGRRGLYTDKRKNQVQFLRELILSK